MGICELGIDHKYLVLNGLLFYLESLKKRFKSDEKILFKILSLKKYIQSIKNY